MSNGFAFHPTCNEVLPFSAQYNFPNQATRQSKRTIKLTPKNNAAVFATNNVIRFEFPASGYLNPTTTYLAFNCRVANLAGSYTKGDTLAGGFEFQNGIQSIFRRCRVLYGSIVLEDIQDYHILNRIFTESVLPSGSMSSASSMLQGIGMSLRQITTSANTAPVPFHGSSIRTNYHATGSDSVPTNVGTTVRRYMVPINTGIFQQKNLIPLKFMASQLSIELEVASCAESGIWVLGTGGNQTAPTDCTIQVGLPELVSELLEFDSEFDRAIYVALEKTGLPIHFQSYHVTTQSIPPNVRSQLNIQESARSVRYALAVIMDDSARSIRKDAHHFVASLACVQDDAVANAESITKNVQSCAVESYQWRLGGTYYPSQPVPCYLRSIPNATGVDAYYADPPVEAYAELVKVFGNLFENDGTYFGVQRNNFFGERRTAAAEADGSTFYASSFVMAGNFLTDRGDIISGINAEEQNDLQLIITFVGTSVAGGSIQAATKTCKVVTCFDNLMILGKSNNLVHVY